MRERFSFIHGHIPRGEISCKFLLGHLYMVLPYNFRGQLSHKFVFICDQFRCSTYQAWIIHLKSVRPLLDAIGVYLEGSEVMICMPVLIQECVKNRISMIFNSRQDILVLIMVLEDVKPIINSDNSVRRQEIK